MYDIIYTFNQEPTKSNEVKVLTVTGLKRRFKERSVYDKETKKFSYIYYDQKQGYSNIND